MTSELRQRAAEGAAMLREVTETAAAAASGVDGLGLRGPGEPRMPSVEESGITAEADAPVHVAWSRVMGEVQFIRKDRQRADTGGRYNFRGIEDVLNAVGGALRKHGVMMLPVGIDPEYSTVTTKGGAVMNYCRATVTFSVIGPRGDMLPRDIVVVGEAFDTGDKSSTKAQSVALRTAYINALAIPTQQPELDPEHGVQHELAAPPPRTPLSYREEILSPDTPRQRMLQIRRELNASPELAGAIVKSEDDESATTLLDLCATIGRQRFAGGGAS